MNWTRVQSDMAKQGYVASDDLSMALHIALTLGKPLLLEGAAGVGKTDIARTLARDGARIACVNCAQLVCVAR